MPCTPRSWLPGTRLPGCGRRGRRQDVTELIERRNPADYDAAVALRKDLAEVCRQAGTAATYANRVEQLRRDHRRMLTFIERLDRAGSI